MVMTAAIEKQLSTNATRMLYALRDANWEVLVVDQDFSDWDLCQKWEIASARENKGFVLVLWFFKYEGKFDGMDRVIVSGIGDKKPSAYETSTVLDLDGNQFDKLLDTFMDALHSLRIAS
ncbi:hypothetical protein N474_01780 [Pseudoalteromonas luteoviolacea CPMOR-2]|uniref:hypothetical protein n=1 Tax=Pseudoalteromonas luteoviolacea TaxID=43657 RepID=UPI0007B052F6|nr:hypothetical protein [Pseudoalteromonas luteoviolacea]KZN54473.1 hypothetical protein N474_01780 [Pseudoalteromonas luteoviolacea CPMOR-2]